MTDPTRAAFPVDAETINLALDAWFDGDCSRPHYDEHIDQMRAAASVIVAALSARAQGEAVAYMVRTASGGALCYPVSRERGIPDPRDGETVTPLYTPPAARAQGDAVLWGLHLQGPDDWYPAPSRAHAEEAARLISKAFAGVDPSPSPIVAQWPLSNEAHAASVAEFICDWIVPRADAKYVQQQFSSTPAFRVVDVDGFTFTTDEVHECIVYLKIDGPRLIPDEIMEQIRTALFALTQPEAE